MLRHADEDHSLAIDLDELSSAVVLFYRHVAKQVEQHARAKEACWLCRAPKRSEFPGTLHDQQAC